MSEENVEIVRRFLHAFVQGDYEASTEHIGAEVVLWSDPRANMETQQVQGREAVSASIGRFVSSFDDYWCAEPDEAPVARGLFALDCVDTTASSRASRAF